MDHAAGWLSVQRQRLSPRTGWFGGHVSPCPAVRCRAGCRSAKFGICERYQCGARTVTAMCTECAQDLPTAYARCSMSRTARTPRTAKPAPAGLWDTSWTVRAAHRHCPKRDGTALHESAELNPPPSPQGGTGSSPVPGTAASEHGSAHPPWPGNADLSNGAEVLDRRAVERTLGNQRSGLCGISAMTTCVEHLSLLGELDGFGLVGGRVGRSTRVVGWRGPRRRGHRSQPPER